MTSVDVEEMVYADLVSVLRHLDPTPLAGSHLFLTGCTGFVGAWLLRALACLNDQGLAVRATVLTRDSVSFAHRNPLLATAPWLHLLTGNVTSTSFDTGPVDFIVHGASAVRPAAMHDGYVVMQDLVIGTQRVLEHAASVGAKRVLLLSSGAVYGPLPEGATAYSEHLNCRVSPTDAYASGKLAMEALALAHARNRGLSAVIARMFAFAGPWLPDHLAVAQILRMMVEEELVRLSGDGKQVRSFLYGADMAVWLLALLAHGENGLICNVGSDEAHELSSLARIAVMQLAPKKAVEMGCAPADPLRNYYVPDIGLARSRFNLAPWSSLSTALDRHFTWLATPHKKGVVS